MNENKRNKILCDFYNRISENQVESVVDIPHEVLKFLSLIDHNEIAKPFIKERMIKGEQASLADWAMWYDVSQRIPRTAKETYSTCAY